MFEVNQLLKVTQGRLVCGSGCETATGISIDSRIIKPREAFIAIKGDNFDGHDFIDQAIEKGARVIIVNSLKSKVSSKNEKNAAFIAVKDTIKALGDIARAHRKKFNIPVIAVTGSNGKTTVKEMVACVLSCAYKVLKNEGTKNNHIGLPMTLTRLDGSYDFAVLEAGTNHFGELEYLARICAPNTGVITNIGPSHLEFFKDLKGVFREKYALVNNLVSPGLAILNNDDSLLKKKVSAKTKTHIVFGVGIDNPSDFSASDIKVSGGQAKFTVNKKFRFTLKTAGYYNIYNALIAIAVGRTFGLSYKDIAVSLSAFDFPKGRLALIELGNLKFIDDTYNSNPLSLKQALETLDNLKVKGRKIFIMGDMLELGTRSQSFHRLAGKKISQVCDKFISVGKLSGLAAEEAQALGLDEKNIFRCESSEEARNILLNRILPEPEDIVLVKGSRSMRMEEVFKI